MTELLTAAQMRAIEEAAIEAGDVTGLELMERAGQGVVDAIYEEWPELMETGQEGAAPHPTGPDSPRRILTEKKSAVVLCGPGNNGGDGFVVARLLKERGWEVEVFLYGDQDKLPPDAKKNLDKWQSCGSTLGWDPVQIDAAEADVFVDAVFGTGLTRPLPKDVGRCLLGLRRYHPPLHRVVAIDAPSGICLDSGKVLSSGAGNSAGTFAHLTVSFHRLKIGHLLDDGLFRCGRSVVADIGLSSSWDEGQVMCTAEETLKNDAIPQLRKCLGDHKYSHGHALVLSGGAGRTGAARLAARGALRIGAGLVTLGVPPSAQMEVASQITGLMLQRVEGAEGFENPLKDSRLNALCLGPGMGLERARELVPVALAAKRATVLDADALSAFADEPNTLFAQLHDDCVLTPHGGEFARLFPDIADKLNETPTKGPAYSKVDATREAAKRAGCTVLFKGPDTVIADPEGRCSINSAHYERSAPWLATAGSGDVLAGFITGLLARGFDPMQATETAAWLHVECARSFGPGLIAEDLPEQIPHVFAGLGL